MSLREKSNHLDFWDKRQIVFYCMAVFVFCNHTSSFLQYSHQIKDTWIQNLSILLQKVFPPTSVPLFLMVSGALFYRDYSNAKYLQKIKSRLYSLVIPFILWNTINMLFEIVATCFFSQYFTGRQGFIFSFENILLGVFNYKYNGPFWFVSALIVFSVLAPAINLIISNKYVGIVSIAAIILLNSVGIKLPKLFYFDQFVYYLIGAYLGKHFFELVKANHFSLPTLIISVLSLIAGWGYKALCEFGIIKVSYSLNCVSLILCSFAIWKILDVSYLLSNKRDFVNHSFWVFALHVNIGAVVTKLLWIVLPKTGEMSIVNFILTILLTLLIIDVICTLTKKICEPLYTILSGSR